jgi:hypothetical protein
MAIGDNDESEEDNFTDMSGISEPDSEEESEEEGETGYQNMNWSDNIPPNSTYDHPQFTDPARGPVKPVTTFLQCVELFLTPEVTNLIVLEPIFGKIMSRNRFEDIFNIIHDFC